MSGLHTVMGYVLKGVEYSSGVINSVIRVNYEVVTVVLYYCVQLMAVVYHCSSVFLTILFNIGSSGIDFLRECCNFIYGFIMLLWKFFRFLASLLDILFRGIELVTNFIMTGGKWTVSALRMSVGDLKLHSCNLSAYVSDIISQWSKVSTGAFALVWEFTFNVISSTFHSLNYILSLSWRIFDSIMIGFAESVRFLTDQIYFFLVYYLPNIPKETYLALITLLLLYLLIQSVLNHLSNRDMTFPFLNRLGQPHRWEENGDDAQFEFSDDDVNVSEVESELDNDSVLDDDEVEEFEVTDDSDDSGSDENLSDDSDGTSTTLSNDIDIQLPPTTNGRYNLRRSTTPSAQISFDNLEDFEREIEKERERQKCVVCQDQNKSVLILPCRHMCLCVNCGNQIARARNVARRTCPLCRQKIRTIMNVYV